MFCAFIVYGQHTEHQNIIVSSNLGHAIMQQDIREYLHCSERLFQILLSLSSTFIGGLLFFFCCCSFITLYLLSISITT